jgi:bifunctional non-homologous end joining protein LigD
VSQRLAFIPPALAVPTKSPPKGDAWVHEAKWDGYRIQIVKDGSDVRLFSKTGTEWTGKLPSMGEAFRGLPARSAILDGELCHSGASGRPDFGALMRQMRKARPDPFHLVVYAFDLLHLNGADVRPLPFRERRQKLVGIDKPLPCLFVIDQFSDGDDLMRWCEKFKLEGVVSKKRDAPYVSGECKAWVKSKCVAWKEENKERGRLFEEAQLRDTTTGRGRR